MDALFLDTSAFIKLYRNEKGSDWLKTFILGKTSYISQLVLIEAATLLGRLYREGLYTQDQAEGLYKVIRQERFNYNILPLGTDRQTRNVANLAFYLPTTLRIRALDGIHLAAALEIQSKLINLQSDNTFTFVTSDVQLLRAAQVQNLTVENQEAYL